MPRQVHVDHLSLSNFKAFKSFTVKFAGDAFLVGPNNAGKSSLISALRFAAQMVRFAMRRGPDTEKEVGGVVQSAYSFRPNQFDVAEENVRHEFHTDETRIDVGFSNDAIISIVWPAESELSAGGGFFFLQEEPGGYQPQSPKEVRQVFPEMGIVPVLAPIEQEETLLSETYVKRNLDSRLASRHFRNQLRLVGYEFTDFVDFAQPWLPELDLDWVVHDPQAGKVNLDVFYEEPESRVPKELYWAGDGMQVWVQLLLHLFRLRAAPVVILDEPDVYLHADLQRRLLRILESLEAQTIAATHSSEILGEAESESVLLVDRTRIRAVQAPQGEVLEELSESIGSVFNLRLARALRTRVALFVEGKDMKLIRLLAAEVGANNLVTERNIAVVPLKGFANWNRIEPFQWFVQTLLEESVVTFVLLDRDYRPDEAVAEVERDLGDLGIDAHVWVRKELESYLLVPEAIARLTGADPAWIRKELDAAAQALEVSVFARFLDERQRYLVDEKHHRVTITELVKAEFDRLWADKTGRLFLCPPKDLLRALNRRLGETNFSGVGHRAIAEALEASEIPPEVRSVLRRIDRAA